MAKKKSKGFFKWHFAKFKLAYILTFGVTIVCGIAFKFDSSWTWQDMAISCFSTIIIFWVIIFLSGVGLFVIKKAAKVAEKTYDSYEYNKMLNKLKPTADGDEVDKDFIRLLEIKPDNLYIHLPNNNRILFALNEFRLTLISFFGFIPNGFAIRHRMTIDSRRLLDLSLLCHVFYEHNLHGEGKPGFIERLRFYKLLYLSYNKEIEGFGNLLVKKHKSKLDKEFLNLYQYFYISGYLAIRDDGSELIH